MCFLKQSFLSQNFSCWCNFTVEFIISPKCSPLTTFCVWALQNATFKGTIISYYRIHWLTGSFDSINECFLMFQIQKAPSGVLSRSVSSSMCFLYIFFFIFFLPNRKNTEQSGLMKIYIFFTSSCSSQLGCNSFFLFLFWDTNCYSTA